MQRTKIEWVKNQDGSQGYSWNPIKGSCPVGCWYCYARKMYKRFKLDERLEFHVTRGDIAKMARLAPSRIFICSTMETFHPSIEDSWRGKIFQTIEMFPKHTFIILTKMPERIDRPMPPNVWLGVTVTTEKEWPRITELAKHKAAIRFISYEPLLGDVRQMNGCFCWIDWVILGDLTGHGKKRQSCKEFLKDIVYPAREFGVPVFMKNSLRDAWGPNLIQELPK